MMQLDMPPSLKADRWPERYFCGGVGTPRHSSRLSDSCQYQSYGYSDPGHGVVGASPDLLCRSRSGSRRAYVVSTPATGISALQLQCQLSLNSYETAWAILHTLQRATVRSERDILKEKDERDEAQHRRT